MVNFASLQSVFPEHGLKAIMRLEPAASVGKPTMLEPSFDQHQDLGGKLGSTYVWCGNRAGITGVESAASASAAA